MRLIDASTTKVSITRFFEFHVSHQKSKRLKEHSSELCRDICFVIDAQQTIDAVPVRHGEWYGEADGYADGELVYDMWYCPFCGKRFEEWDEKPNWNYCPNCGADMRGE